LSAFTVLIDLICCIKALVTYLHYTNDRLNTRFASITVLSVLQSVRFSMHWLACRRGSLRFA